MHRSPSLDATEYLDAATPELQRFLNRADSSEAFKRLDDDTVRVLLGRAGGVIAVGQSGGVWLWNPPLPPRRKGGLGGRPGGGAAIAGNSVLAVIDGERLVELGDAGGAVHERASFPLGAMRVASLRAKGPGQLKRAVALAVRSLAWRGEAAGKPLYLVGGSWRALARLHMHLVQCPLPVIANYGFPAGEVARMRRSLAATGLASPSVARRTVRSSPSPSRSCPPRRAGRAGR